MDPLRVRKSISKRVQRSPIVQPIGQQKWEDYDIDMINTHQRACAALMDMRFETFIACIAGAHTSTYKFMTDNRLENGSSTLLHQIEVNTRVAYLRGVLDCAIPNASDNPKCVRIFNERGREILEKIGECMAELEDIMQECF